MIEIGPLLAHVIKVVASALFLSFVVKAVGPQNKWVQGALITGVVVGYFILVGVL